jgi:hypothetical protein
VVESVKTIHSQLTIADSAGEVTLIDTSPQAAAILSFSAPLLLPSCSSFSLLILPPLTMRIPGGLTPLLSRFLSAIFLLSLFLLSQTDIAHLMLLPSSPTMMTMVNPSLHIVNDTSTSVNLPSQDWDPSVASHPLPQQRVESSNFL